MISLLSAMEVEAVTQLLLEASEKRKACRITLRREPISRVVHPYGVCRTQANTIVLVCWQAMGFTGAGGKAGFRNLKLSKIQDVEILDSGFRVSPDFNTTDGQYVEWVFHL